jgi:hypothetical protein
MGEFIVSQVAALEDDIRAAPIASDVKHTAAWCFGHLPALYRQYCETRESRYGDEITRLVVAVLMKLADGQRACLASEKLATGITNRLRDLHGELGLPGLKLKLPDAPRSPARKVKVRSAIPRSAS